MRDASRIIESQKESGSATDRGNRQNPGLLKLEVLTPNLQPRIEQEESCSRHRINRCEIGAFQPIAIKTSQSKVFHLWQPSMLRRDDVVGFVRDQAIILMHKTVLATTLGSAPHRGPD
jgi:hypothetical protein